MKTVRLVGFIFVAMLFQGCATSEQVKKIVDDSNKTIVVASIEQSQQLAIDALAGGGSTLTPQPASTDATAWKAEVGRIEEFIANHPDQVRTNNTLRVREAVLLLNAKQPNLARAVFGEVECANLSSIRDRAICDVQEPLIWWYSLGTAMSSNDAEKARQALSGIGEAADKLERTSSIRRSLEQIRVRIALRLARTLEAQEMQAVLSEALNRYAAQFDASDRKAIQSWHMTNDLPEGQRAAMLSSLRWYDYVPKAFSIADDLNDQICGENCENFTPPWVACIKDNNCAATNPGE